MVRLRRPLRNNSIIILDSRLNEELENAKKTNSPYYEEFIKQAKYGHLKILNLKGWDVKCSDGQYRSANFMLGNGYLKDVSKSVINRIQKGEKLEDILYCDIEKDFIEIIQDDIDTSVLIQRKSPKEKEGNIVDLSGKVLGKHKGIWNYTIGQRKGIGVSFNLSSLTSRFLALLPCNRISLR